MLNRVKCFSEIYQNAYGRLSKADVIDSSKVTSAMNVEWFFRNPNWYW